MRFNVYFPIQTSTFEHKLWRQFSKPFLSSLTFPSEHEDAITKTLRMFVSNLKSLKLGNGKISRLLCNFGCFKKYFDVYFAFMLIEFHPWTWNLINYFEIEKMEIVLKSFFFGQQKRENLRMNLLPRIRKLLCWPFQVFFSFEIVLKFHTKNSSRWMSKKGRLRRQRYLKMSWNDNLCQRKNKTGEKT